MIRKTLGFFAIFIISFTNLEARRTQSDSILELIDTRHVEQIIAERRANESRHGKRMPVPFYEPEVVNFEVSSGNKNHNEEQLIQYNDTDPQPIFYPNIEDFRGNKYLKSSKNALYITRKEYLKKDWCNMEPLVQRIRHEGCLSRTIMNRFCYGQCNSFYIPKGPRRRRQRPSQSTTAQDTVDLEEEDLTVARFKSCAFCKPKEVGWVTITLRCPSLSPPFRRKRIQRIKQCRCMAESVN